MEEPVLNAHNKDEFPPAHTAEHLLNATMVRNASVTTFSQNTLPVTAEYMSKDEAASIVDLSKLPEDASETLRIVRIGDYDACACIGAHVENTSEIGEFRILSHDFNEGVWRLRWKVISAD